MANEDAVNNPYQQQQQQQAQMYGLTTDQYNALVSQYTPAQVANTQGGQYGKSSGVSLQQNPDLTNTLNTLGALKTAGISLGGSQQQNTGPTAGQVSTDPQNQATNMGAAALGMPAIYNPTPSQFTNAKGGVSNVPSPVSSGTAPTMPYGPWSTNPGGLGTTSPGTTPNAQGQLPGTPTPTAIPNPRGSTPASPWATAPAAPGANAVAPTTVATAAPPPDPMTHYQGLINAGKAIVSHYGGNPDSMSEDDLNNFHSALQSHIANAFGGAPAGAQNYTAGVPAGGKMPLPMKMAQGGQVPGSTDTVPAMLTPGEFIMNRGAVNRIGLGNLQAMNRPQGYAEGGPVTSDDGGYNQWRQVVDPYEVNYNRAAYDAMSASERQDIARGATKTGYADGGSVDDSQPPEARRRNLATDSSQPSQGQTSQTGSTQPQPAPVTPPAAPGGIFGDAAGYAAQARAMQAANLNSGGASGGGYNIPSNLGGGYIGASPGVGESGYYYPNQAAATAAGDVGPGVAGGTAPAGAQTIAASGAISNLAQGLSSAAQTYANSIKPWQTQPDATEKFAGNVVRQQPAAFQQQNLGGQQKQQNPYTALMPYMT